MTSRATRTLRQLLCGIAGIALALSLGACGAPARDLPERPPLADRQALDLCALVPKEQLAELSDTLGRGWMSQQLGTCSISGVFTIRLSLAPPELPDVVAREEPDVDVTEVPGGLVIDSLPHSPCSQRTLVSDTGHVMVLDGIAGSTTDCGNIDLLGPLVLRNLA